MAFLLLLLALVMVKALREGGRAEAALGLLGLAFGSLFLAPGSAWIASHYDGRELGNITMLQNDLTALGGERLSGRVQCVDSINGCTNVLYRMRLLETSNVFYDEFLFGPASEKAVRLNREKFWNDIQDHPPQVIVVTDRLFPDGPGNYGKLALWPQFEDELRQNYELAVERKPQMLVRWWSKAEIPAGYRMYVRR